MQHWENGIPSPQGRLFCPAQISKAKAPRLQANTMYARRVRNESTAPIRAAPYSMGQLSTDSCGRAWRADSTAIRQNNRA